MEKVVLAAVLAAGFVTPAISDEVWTTNIGEVFYETDHADTAIFRLQHDERLFRIYLPGFASMLDDRTTHTGFWVSNDHGHCPVSLGTPDGSDYFSWGEVTMVWDEFQFPSAWTAVMSECFGDPVLGIRAEPWME